MTTVYEGIRKRTQKFMIANKKLWHENADLADSYLRKFCRAIDDPERQRTIIHNQKADLIIYGIKNDE